MNVVSMGLVFLFIMILVNVIAFSLMTLSLTVIVFCIYIYFIIFQLSKYVFSVIEIHAVGITCRHRNKVLYMFNWDDFTNLSLGVFMMTPTLNFELSEKEAIKYGIKIFQIDCNEDILSSIENMCTNMEIAEKILPIRNRK